MNEQILIQVKNICTISEFVSVLLTSVDHICIALNNQRVLNAGREPLFIKYLFETIQNKGWFLFSVSHLLGKACYVMNFHFKQN